MTAQIVSIASARQRFAPRIAARTEAREAIELEAARELWGAELQTWPKPFRRVLDDWMEFPNDPRALCVDTLDRTAERARAERLDCAEIVLRVTRELATTHFRSRHGGLHHHIRNSLRRHARDQREMLLQTLWIHGVRRIDRDRLEPAARAYVQQQEASTVEWMISRRKIAERQRAAIASGRIMTGPNAGKPFTEAGIRRAEGVAAARDRQAAQAEWELAHVFPWAHANPVKYATGCWPRWMRPAR